MGARPFLDLLREHRNGLTHEELTEELQKLVAAVVEERKAGTLTLKIKLEPKGDGTVMLVDEVVAKPPKRTKGGSLFFVTPENNLARQDPRQNNLPLREIGGREAAREIGAVPASAANALA